MANWSSLKAAIAQVIKTNGNQEITGANMQSVLNNIVNSVGENATFAGIATPSTNPGNPDGNVFYLATEAGTYSNFNGIEIASGEAVILEWKGSWIKKISGLATRQQFSELEEYIFVYPSGLFPVITKSGEGSSPTYNVEFKPGTYFIINKNSGISKQLILEETSFDVSAGQMLVCDNKVPELKVISQLDKNVTNRTVLLNNMRLVSGAFEALIIKELETNVTNLETNVTNLETNVTNLEKYSSDYLFVYPSGLFPVITKSGQGSSPTYNVEFKPGTYYVIEKNGIEVKTIDYTGVQSFEIPAGYMLVCDNETPELKVISQTDKNITNRTVLLNNMRLVSGAFEALINNEFINVTQEVTYATFESNNNITSGIDKEIFKHVAPLIKCNVFVDDENINDIIGVGVLENNTRNDNKARFYMYDKTKGYNISVIDIDIPKGESLLKGTTRHLGNYTVNGRINCWLDVVINWDLYETNTTTVDPTILIKPFAIGSLQYINTFPWFQSRISGAASEFFTVEVNGEKPNSENGFDSISSDIVANNRQYNDMCHYQQPKSDKPMKLLILCHGGGVTVTETVDNWYNYQNIGKIFNALGYAVLLTNGMPRDWADEKGIGIDRQCGNWMAVQSVVKAYDYVINKYNIDPNGCYVYGQSQGGMVAENIAELSGLPILATILESPAISMQYAQLYIDRAISYLNALYGFNSQETYNKEKCIGLDPLLRNVYPDIIMTGNSVSTLDIDIDTMKQKKYRTNTPILIIRSLADTTISPKLIGAYAKAIINGGGNCKLITYTSAGHSTIASTSVIGSIDGYDVRASLYEIIVFLEANGGYSSNKVSLIVE